MQTNFTITETTPTGKRGKKNNELNYGGGRWVRGTIGDYVYDAKVYPCGSRFGIHESNISKLSIRDAATKIEAAAYDRGWDILPESQEVIDMVDALVEHYWA